MHLEASLLAARTLKADFEVALTLGRLAVDPGSAPARIVARDHEEAARILDSLGVVSLPAVPGVAGSPRP